MQGSGKSSQSIWTPFDSVTTSSIRPIRAKVSIAWTRIENVTNYATIGASVISGTDIIQGSGESSINSADSFEYFDETDRVIRVEYERHLLEPLGGMSMAIANIVLDNTDLRLTPTFNSTIGTALRPNRPIKIFIGFEVQGQDKLIPIIEGLTDDPKEDKLRRTVSIQAYDFLNLINTKPQETTIYQDQRSDEIIADILSRAGIGSGSYELDQGLNTVGFAWFEKGQTAGKRIRKLCEAEEALFYQDETGNLLFENRDKNSSPPYTTACWTIKANDIINWNTKASSKIINRALISGKPRSIKGETEIWRNGVEEEIGAGESVVIWANFQDPCSSLTTPVETTDFTAFDATGGAGSNISSDITVSMDAFTTAAKFTITNNNASKAYLNFLRLRGTPATVDYEIREVFQDTVSVDDYTEKQLTVDNPYIDDKKFAANMAQDIVRRYKNPNDVIKLTVRGIPQLQLRDRIKVIDQDVDTTTEYRLIGIQGVFEPGSFTQKLTLRKIRDSVGL